MPPGTVKMTLMNWFRKSKSLCYLITKAPPLSVFMCKHIKLSSFYVKRFKCSYPMYNVSNFYVRSSTLILVSKTLKSFSIIAVVQFCSKVLFMHNTTDIHQKEICISFKFFNQNIVEYLTKGDYSRGLHARWL